MDFQTEFDRIYDDVLSRRGEYGDAADEAAELIKRRGVVEEFFAEYGRECLIDLFRQLAHQRREMAAGPAPRRPGGPKVTTAINHPDAVFAIPFTVGGKQRRLGDLVAADCDWLRRAYARRAETLEGRASFFGSLASRLRRAGAATVRHAFKGQSVKLLKLYKKGFGDE